MNKQKSVVGAPVFPVILAGGSGSRLWPLSRQRYPKQFISLVDEYSLLQNTVRRLEWVEGLRPPIVVCHEEHRFIVAQQLQAIGASSTAIVLEPVARNTAPAAAAAAYAAKACCSRGEEPILLLCPADHVIDGADAFAHALTLAIEAARQNHIAILGLAPDAPATGYGYIKVGAPLAPGGEVFAVEDFIEKPNATLAADFLKQGGYCWNAGIFVCSAASYFSALNRHAPLIARAVAAAWQQASHNSDFIRLEASAFTASPSISLDYAVLESAANIVMAHLPVTWSDLGSWESLARLEQMDAAGNITHGDVLLQDAKNTYVYGDTRLIAAIGVSDLIIIDTADALLVAAKSATEDTKTMVARLLQEERTEAITHTKVHRPWGSYTNLGTGKDFLAKHILVDAHQSLSLQAHQHRAEHWVVLRGIAKVTCGDQTYLVRPNESTFIPLGALHRLENPGNLPLELIEVQSGSQISEDDIVRFQDSYGRCTDASGTAAGST